MRKYIIWLIVLAIFFSEIILKINSIAGLIFYAFLTITFLILFLRSKLLDNVSKLTLILLIFPITRMGNLFLDLPFFWRTLVVYYFFLFLVIFYFAKFRENIGFTKPKLKFILLAIFFGFFFGLIGNIFLGIQKNSLLVLILPVASLAEEIYFRGLTQNLTEKTYNRKHSIILTSVLYGTAALTFGIIPAIFFFFLSLVSCLLYSKTKNIFLTLIINFIVSLFVFIIPKWL